MDLRSTEQMDNRDIQAVPTIVDGVITAWTITYDGTSPPVDPVKAAVEAEREECARMVETMMFSTEEWRAGNILRRAAECIRCRGAWRDIPDPFKGAVIVERQRIEAAVLPLLAGIDNDDSMEDGGWWETIDGAKFGADVLAKVKAAIRGEKP